MDPCSTLLLSRTLPEKRIDYILGTEITDDLNEVRKEGWKEEGKDAFQKYSTRPRCFPWAPAGVSRPHSNPRTMFYPRAESSSGEESQVPEVHGKERSKKKVV